MCLAEPLRRLVVIFIFLLLLGACTSSPFKNEENISDRRSVGGTVVLSDGSSPQGVVVWMEHFDLLTTADTAGNFEITLPPPAQGASSGTIEPYKIYFYVSNFFLDSAQVFVQNGDFLRGRGDIDGRGKLARPVRMRRMFRIRTEVVPAFAKVNSNTRIEVTVRMRADSVCVPVTNVGILANEMGDPPDTLGVAIFKKQGSDQFFLFKTAPAATSSEAVNICPTQDQIRYFDFDLQRLPLDAGSYEIIPFLIFEPFDVPPAMMVKIGRALQPDANYLNKPARREGGLFEVRP